MTAPVDAARLAAMLPAVLAARDRRAVERLLAPDVRWGGEQDTEQTCHDRTRAGETYAALLAGGVELRVLDTRVDGERVRAWIAVTGPDEAGHDVQVLLTVQDGLVVDVLQLDDDETPAVELLHVAGCPNSATFLPHLRHVLTERGVRGRVQLVEVSDEQEAHRLRFLGSPTLRIGGRDVEPGADRRSGYGLQCRVYRTADGAAGAPPDAWILDALDR